MSTDLPDGNEGQRSTGSGRSPRLGDARSPVGSTLSIVLAVVAVIAGFLILRELTDDDGGSEADTELPADSTAPGATTPEGGSTGGSANALDPAVTSPPSAAPKTYAGATIAVANSSGVSGSAASMSAALGTEGYEGIGDPGNGNTGEDLTTTVVHYVNGNAPAEAVARSIAADLGGVSVAPMPETRPVEGGSTADATVLVVLGTDTAGQAISELRGGAATAATGP